MRGSLGPDKIEKMMLLSRLIAPLIPGLTKFQSERAALNACIGVHWNASVSLPVARPLSYVDARCE